MAKNKPLIIADASVIVKWVLYEPADYENALNLRKDITSRKIHVMVPPHCFSEVCNILGRKASTLAIPFISHLLTSSIIRSHLTLELSSLALKLMAQYPKISFYDAVYHALAIQEKGTFVTADKQYYETTHKEGHIQLLKDYA